MASKLVDAHQLALACSEDKRGRARRRTQGGGVTRQLLVKSEWEMEVFTERLDVVALETKLAIVRRNELGTAWCKPYAKPGMQRLQWKRQL
ncbi:hypothetical protein SERLA73DRAFT_129510 [Serpula lacrymans var. lacrymans S7.3]|uniref:Uncharacterized protein n=2 Tax=Serpula lacrymans var. lacrymans TaxID=341189 RepID=F8PJN4_SERL3|nr:uncharacterized protein SERLADRAFT_456340 [Serpula lacrymans var. lacrymans S7.9]EGO03235.1 hypothetical protein SERLA73DRAFT_129510 [Serpula lacrymans var. lacrymans S7.3]EGO29018.1 hypothetical protein SERLADRAFT_456340 [Serpula lacrymans var. lacrymans S7.9]